MALLFVKKNCQWPCGFVIRVIRRRSKSKQSAVETINKSADITQDESGKAASNIMNISRP